MLDYPGRPALVTLGNNTPAPAPGLLAYVPPVQTLPCDLTAPTAQGCWARGCGSSGCGSGGSGGPVSSGSAADERGAPLLLSLGPQPPGGDGGGAGGGAPDVAAAPRWEEDLALDAPREALASEDALLIAEVLQLPGGFRDYRRRPGSGGGAQAVSWGFLRLRGLGVAALGPEPRRVSLQLYEYLPPRGGWGLWGLRGPAVHCQPLANHLAPSPAAAALASPAPFPDTTAKAAYLSWRATLGAGGAGAAAARGREPPAAAQQQPAPGSPPRPGPGKLRAALEVSLMAPARPEGVVVVTDAAAGLRPALPAGYGGGYEIGEFRGDGGWRLRGADGAAGASGSRTKTLASAIGHRLTLPAARRAPPPGRLPFGSLRLPRGRSSDAAAASLPGAAADTARASCEARAALEAERRLHRHFTAPCEPPNAAFAAARGGAGGAAAVAYSRDGRWLAAACGGAEGAFKARAARRGWACQESGLNAVARMAVNKCIGRARLPAAPNPTLPTPCPLPPLPGGGVPRPHRAAGGGAGRP
jgi:hypothetical protein